MNLIDHLTHIQSASVRDDCTLAAWQKRVLSCATASEYFATMRDFRASNPTDHEIAQLYEIAALKFAVIKGCGAYMQEEIERRLGCPSMSPGAVATGPLSLSQARALRRKYETTGTLWDRFWFWIDKKIEGGADAAFAEESEKALTQACNEP